MFKIPQCTILMIALIALLGGCGVPSWDEFDQIQLSRPLPATLPGGMTRTILGAGYIGLHGDVGSDPSEVRIANALTNANDLVTAKACLTIATAHRLLYVQVGYRYVIEVNLREAMLAGKNRSVPEELKLLASISQSVADTPSDARGGKPEDYDRVMPPARGEIDRCMKIMKDAIFEAYGNPDDSDITQMRGRQYADASKRFSKASSESLAIGMARKKVEQRMRSLPFPSGGGGTHAFIPANIPEAMLYSHILLNTLTRPTNSENATDTSTAFSMYQQHAHENVLELLGDPDTYRGSNADGFDRKWKTLGGTNVHISRTGHHLRAEISGTVLREPFATR
ncbi:MAG: hypothetical protein GY794_22260 [bacterium]|nr:hypothetical protein [bacterium]